MIRIKREILPQSSRIRPGYKMDPKYITVHNTANTSTGANAKAHAKYLLSGAGGRSVSWHFTVDDTEIYQHLPTDESGWHTGDGNGPGNRRSIGIEICENRDGDFEKAVENAQWLIRKLMAEHNIPIENVVPHKKWTGKNCPRKLLDRWDEFAAGIQKEGRVQPASSKPKTKPVSQPKQTSNKANLTVDGKWGPATTRELQKALGTVVDGYISNQIKNQATQALYSCVKFGRGGSLVIRALQKKVGARVDGYLGPETVQKTQKYLGTPVDGVISRPSSLMVKEMQQRLNKGTF